MNREFEPLEQNAIVYIKESDTLISGYTTFEVSELVEAMQNQIGQSENWFKGIECEILSPNRGLHKGKVRIALEFCGEELELLEQDDHQPTPNLSEDLLNEVWQLLLNSVE
ncbi:hypothetical protein H6G00_10925 [Leptolyngbya sp. FACHB-541]|uniref:KGK domain-containing protein n=1 Tax=Leptolyngbya sp. FACHB-541 TaxID=2692810 RepID=UPI001684F167|nr:KGK domain-containing protein [Leptolyngbya sp. FACHB-541]MBD1997131.1 hypothetical protein [Leptolyngbya sp. FACHB-541]